VNLEVQAIGLSRETDEPGPRISVPGGPKGLRRRWPKALSIADRRGSVGPRRRSPGRGQALRLGSWGNMIELSEILPGAGA
jgi:hypothetical protein